MSVVSEPPGVIGLLEMHCRETGEDLATVRDEIARERERDARRYRAAAAPRPHLVQTPTASPAADLQRFRAEMSAAMRAEIARAVEGLRSELARDLPTAINHIVGRSRCNGVNHS
jgi:hypothetical protein